MGIHRAKSKKGQELKADMPVILNKQNKKLFSGEGGGGSLTVDENSLDFFCLLEFNYLKIFETYTYIII